MKKVLIVDDEDHIRRLLVMTLSGGEYEILQARDGVKGLELARSEHPDVVLLDVTMPGINGVEVCRQIKNDANLKKMTVVMLTATSQDSVKRQAILAGADLFLAKPFSPLQVLDVVERHVAKG